MLTIGSFKELDMSYNITYEALVYNFPICQGYSLLGNSFVINGLTMEMEEHLAPHKMPLLANPTFYACIVNTKEFGPQYMVMKNETPIPMDLPIDAGTDAKNAIYESVVRAVETVEKHLLFTLNFPVFFPIVWLKVVAEDGKVIENYMRLRNVPVSPPGGKWTSHLGLLDINKRMGAGFSKESLDEFLSNKNCVRYKHAYEYYIRSFYETSHDTSFCCLLSSIDAITGSRNKEHLTKVRLAKYSSVLLCEPLLIEKNEQVMKLFYKQRSEFVHGKGTRIKVGDEFVLREYVRIFLITYFLFWQELKVTNEPQMLQKLDSIYNDQSLYTKETPCAYFFVSAMRKHERGFERMFEITLEEQERLAHRILSEPLESQYLRVQAGN